MPVARTRRAKAESELQHPNPVITVVDDGQIRAQFEERRVQMLEGLRVAGEIVKRRGSPGMLRHFQNVRESLIGMEERATRNDLPDAYLRILLNDARLDSLILLSQVRVAMLYEHQRLLAPTEKLRSEIEASIERLLDGQAEPPAYDGLDIQQELGMLGRDFEDLARAEKLIRDQELRSCSTSTTGGGKKSNLPSKS